MKSTNQKETVCLHSQQMQPLHVPSEDQDKFLRQISAIHPAVGQKANDLFKWNRAKRDMKGYLFRRVSEHVLIEVLHALGISQ
jgi:hypothetical protein